MPIDSTLLAALKEHCGHLGSSFANVGSSRVKVEPNGPLLFAKLTSPVEQVLGESASLRALGDACKAATLEGKQVIVPHVYGSGASGSGKAYLITDYLDLSSHINAAGQSKLGERLAKMHSAPLPVRDDERERYGFPVPTHCGATEQDNTWESDWRAFWEKRRIGNLVQRIGNPQLTTLHEKMQSSGVYDILLDPVKDAHPSCIHGDLWAGNAGTDTNTGEPYIFESSYYGHGEAELGMTRMFGGFTSDFYEAYHKVLPKSQPHYEERISLYELYHHLNHTLMFGGGYRSGAASIMKRLIAFAESEGTAGAGAVTEDRSRKPGL